MNKKTFIYSLLVGVAIGAAINVTGGILNRGGSEAERQSLEQSREALVQSQFEAYNTMFHADDFDPTGFAGDFLASHFAQNRYDWRKANEFLKDVIEQDGTNYELIKRSMILAIGSGEIKLAAERAKALTALEPDNNFALLVLVVEAMQEDNPQDAISYLDQMPPGDMTMFITPLLKGWAYAGMGVYYDEDYNGTPFHSFHRALIAMHTGKTDIARDTLNEIMSIINLNEIDAERVADIYLYLGDVDTALPVYKGAFVKNSQNKLLAEKIEALEAGNIEEAKDLADEIDFDNVGEGAAMAFYDMAYLLYRELSDSSAKIFANMALALDKDIYPAYMLLADITTRNERFSEAIRFLEKIPEGHERYMDTQRRIAELQAELGNMDEAVAHLQRLFTEYDDVESLIRIGDLYRESEDYGQALDVYNKAAREIGGTIPEDYWYLLYARGMAYEREGDWKKAEDDLKAALVYRPNHPYLLNYLGYSWADQGVKLEEAKDLIKQAVMLRPTDGYITDSLGWVIYMMGDYEEAVPYLEKAVSLLPYDATINDHLGDALWRVGRKTEARFQWERALNATEDETLAEKIRGKMRFGLDADVKAAQSAKSGTSGVAE